MATGQLSFSVSTAQQALPVEAVQVVITKVSEGQVVYDQTLITDEDGNTPAIDLEAPDKALSLDPGYEGFPYEVYDVQFRKEGYVPAEVRDIQIFADTLAVQVIEMIPDATDNYTGPRQVSTVPQHHLTCECPCFSTAPAEKNVENRILQVPVIPTNITVHLGRPNNSSAENLTVPFKYYIKNVASSEIYPTWPENALRANIYCQISLALNRVYTEWYRSKGCLLYTSDAADD